MLQNHSCIFETNKRKKNKMKNHSCISNEEGGKENNTHDKSETPRLSPITPNETCNNCP
jgi:hypothetical protein